MNPEHRGLRIGHEFRRDRPQPGVELFEKLPQRPADLGLVDLPPGRKPLPAVVSLEPAQELERGGPESREGHWTVTCLGFLRFPNPGVSALVPRRVYQVRRMWLPFRRVSSNHGCPT